MFKDMIENMRKIKAFKSILIVFALITVTILNVTGCEKKKEKFDFSTVSAVRVYDADDEHMVEIQDDAKAYDAVKSIESIVWDKDKNKDLKAPSDAAYIYRIQCYNKKGKKTKLIKVVSEGRIVYDGYYWNAPEDSQIDLDTYKQMFD